MITYDDFIESCHHMVKISDKFGDGWKLVQDKQHIYLIKSHILRQEKTNNLEMVNKMSGILTELEEQNSEDPLSLKTRLSQETYHSEVHIIYSIGYCVPVFYFNIWNQNGRLLSLQSVWGILSQFNLNILKDKWKTVSQIDHPVRGTPFYYFHPCNTSEVMAIFTKSVSSVESVKMKYYLPNWVNIYGSPLGLSVSLRYIVA